MGNDEILKVELEKAVAECERLREENARLRVRVGQASDTLAPTPNQFSAHNNKKAQASATVTAESPPQLKVSLFSSLFRGRDDVYAVRWEGKNGRTGYSPAGIREWDQAPSQSAVAFEEVRGCKVESVESDTRGFDLFSRRPVSDSARERIETRFIEVKGRAAVGEIALTANEYKTAQRLGDDYWLYVVFNCASQPQVTTIQNPARFDWEPLSKIDCYRIKPETILKSHR